MGCVELLKGLDLSCKEVRAGAYYQNVVLVNRADVKQVRIVSNGERHRIRFNLKEGRSGYLFRGNDLGRAFTASFTKSVERGVPQYGHNLQLPIWGIGEREKILLMELDAADFFAAIQFESGEIEIYGFQHGLTTGNYTYAPQEGFGGALIPLSSRSEEYTPPFIYEAAGSEEMNYERLFQGIGDLVGGDFNDDFSDDFDNGKAEV